MARIVYQLLDCELKTSPVCNGQFQRPVKRGRVPKVCPDCKAVKVIPGVKTSTKTPSDPVVVGEEKTATCPCGNEFTFVKPARGRSREKCDGCRDAGIIYRQNDSGGFDAKTFEDQQAEERERKEALGHERAAALVKMMHPLLQKKHRTVIVH